MTTAPGNSLNIFAAQVLTPPSYTPASGVDAVSPDLTAGLTPDALMAYCQSRLDSIDGQVQTLMDQQTQDANLVGTLQTSADLFKSMSAGNQTGSINPNAPVLQAGQTPSTTENNVQQMYDSLNSAIAQVKAADPNSPALPKLEQTLASLKSTAGDNLVSQSEIEGYAQAISDAAGDLNSDAELGMVNIQSLMSQRETAISLTTNLVQSLGDGESKIADNIGK